MMQMMGGFHSEDAPAMVGEPTDPNFASVVLLLDATRGAGDKSPSGHTLTWAGNPTTIGNEIVFAGAQVLSAPDHANWLFDGDFTLELFGVKFANDTQAGILASQYLTTGNQRSWRVVFSGDASPKVLGINLSGNGSAVTTVSGNFAPTVNQAYDLAIDRSGSTVRVYVDGAMIASGTFAGSLFNSTTAFRLGADGTTISFVGRLKAARITKGVARYASDDGYSVPSLPLPTQ